MKLREAIKAGFTLVGEEEIVVTPRMSWKFPGGQFFTEPLAITVPFIRATIMLPDDDPIYLPERFELVGIVNAAELDSPLGPLAPGTVRVTQIAGREVTLAIRPGIPWNNLFSPSGTWERVVNAEGNPLYREVDFP